MSRHLRVLEAASPIEAARRGQHRVRRLRPDALISARDRLERHHRLRTGASRGTERGLI
jgi:hypothetical protein